MEAIETYNRAMIEWPPGLQTPDAGLIFKTCLSRFGTDYHGKSISTAVTAIWVKEIIYSGRTRRNMWTISAAVCGLKVDALKQAYQRSGNKKWARWLSVGLINEMVRKQTALTRK